MSSVSTSDWRAVAVWKSGSEEILCLDYTQPGVLDKYKDKLKGYRRAGIDYIAIQYWTGNHWRDVDRRGV